MSAVPLNEVLDALRGEWSDSSRCWLADRIDAHGIAPSSISFKDEGELVAFLDSLHASDGSAVTNNKWEVAQKAINGIRGIAPPDGMVLVKDEPVAWTDEYELKIRRPVGRIWFSGKRYEGDIPVYIAAAPEVSNEP